uniref:Uncharacterized protein n=1 Tax=Avena sativa TaxID=4498 RepID=A0ACD5UTG0_AVESA
MEKSGFLASNPSAQNGRNSPPPVYKNPYRFALFSHRIPQPTRRLRSSPFSKVLPLSSAMAGGNLFGRALSYVVNQFLVEGLANNRAFQRFAVRTNRTFENLSSKAKEVKQEVSEKWKDVRGQDDHFRQ